MASVSFRDPEEADYCIQTLDGRWFGGRQITAQAWDGTTDYQVNSVTVKGTAVVSLPTNTGLVVLWVPLNLFNVTVLLLNNTLHSEPRKKNVLVFQFRGLKFGGVLRIVISKVQAEFKYYRFR